MGWALGGPRASKPWSGSYVGLLAGAPGEQVFKQLEAGTEMPLLLALVHHLQKLLADEVFVVLSHGQKSYLISSA